MTSSKFAKNYWTNIISHVSDKQYSANETTLSPQKTLRQSPWRSLPTLDVRIFKIIYLDYRFIYQTIHSHIPQDQIFTMSGADP